MCTYICMLAIGYSLLTIPYVRLSQVKFGKESDEDEEGGEEEGGGEEGVEEEPPSKKPHWVK